MKKNLFILLSIIIIISMISCGNNRRKSQSSIDSIAVNDVAKSVPQKKYKVMTLVDSLVTNNPNMLSNEIQSKRFCKELVNEISKQYTEDENYLSEIPVKFSQMLQKGNKYILKFEAGEFSTDDKQLISEKNNVRVDFAIFTIATEDFAANLKDNATYRIKGKFKGLVNGKIVLPSGNLFDYPASCTKYSLGGEYIGICLGGYLFENIEIIK